MRSALGGLGDLAALVWPTRCPGCGAPDVATCPPCRAALTAHPRHAAPPAWPEGPGVHAATAYAGPAARLVVAWKERGRHDLTRVLAPALASALHAATAAPDPDPWSAGWPEPTLGAAQAPLAAGAAGAPVPHAGRDVLLVPIPTVRRNRRRRGGDLVLDLTRAAARAARDGPDPRFTVVSALRHVRRVRDQSELDATRRRRNLEGALAVRRDTRDLQGREVVIVDDVVTTGATAAEAARALTSAGALVVAACCLCVTEKQQGVSVADSLL